MEKEYCMQSDALTKSRHVGVQYFQHPLGTPLWGKIENGPWQLRPKVTQNTVQLVLKLRKEGKPHEKNPNSKYIVIKRKEEEKTIAKQLCPSLPVDRVESETYAQ